MGSESPLLIMISFLLLSQLFLHDWRLSLLSPPVKWWEIVVGLLPRSCVEERSEASLEKNGEIVTVSNQLELASNDVIEPLRVYAALFSQISTSVTNQIVKSFGVKGDSQDQVKVLAVMICPQCPNALLIREWDFEADVTVTSEDGLTHTLAINPVREFSNVLLKFPFFKRSSLWRRLTCIPALVVAIIEALIICIFMGIDISLSQGSFAFSEAPCWGVSYLSAISVIKFGVPARISKVNLLSEANRWPERIQWWGLEVESLLDYFSVIWYVVFIVVVEFFSLSFIPCISFT